MKPFSLSRIKDAALEKAVLMFLRPKAERYGEIKALSIDTKGKRISAEICLHGEKEPLIISEALYRVEQTGPEAMLVIYGVKVSKPWAQHLLEDHFQEISLKVPDFV